MAQPDMTAYERERMLENWIYHLAHASLSIANQFVFVFEQMIAGGNRPGCPLFGKAWPAGADGQLVAGNGFTDADVQWIRGPRTAPAPAGMLDKMFNYSGGAFQTEMLGGMVVFAESEALAGPWVQRGYPFLV